MRRTLKHLNKPFLATCLIMGIGFSWVVSRQNDTISELQGVVDVIEQQSIDADYKTCLSGNRLRASLREVLLQSSRGAGIPDPRTLPEYKLMDAGDQAYWLAFVNLLNTPRSVESNIRLADNLERLKDRNCDKLYPKRTPGIALVPDP